MTDANAVNTPSSAAPKITREYFEEHEVYKSYKGYLCSAVDAKDDNLDNFFQACVHFGYIPSLELIDWIIDETNIIDVTRRLEFPVYTFLQEYKFKLYVSPVTGQPRMFVGYANSYLVRLPLWAGWTAASANGSKAKMKLYYTCEAEKNNAHEAQILEELRFTIDWEEPFERLFKFSAYKSDNASAQIQNAILLSVAKVVIRFPGLILPAPGSEDTPAAEMMRRKFSGRPFDVREVPSPFNPCYDGHIIVQSGVDPLAEIHRNHPPNSEEFEMYLQKLDEEAKNKRRKLEEKKAKQSIDS